MEAPGLAAYGIYPDQVSLTDVLKTLNHGGFHDENICVMLSPTHPIATVVREANILNAEREQNAATAGLIGWLGKFGAVVIPSVGFFIRSRKFFHAIVAEKGSMTGCGSSTMLVGLGFPEHEAERFKDRLRDVGVLVYVLCPESAKTKWALELLRGTGAEEAGTLENEELAAVC